MLLPQVSAAFQERTGCLALDSSYRIRVEALAYRFHRGAIDESEFVQQRSEALRSYQEAVEACAQTARDLPKDVAPHRPMLVYHAPQARGPASVAEDNSYYTRTSNSRYEEIQSSNDDIYEDME